MKRLSRKKLTEKVDVLEQMVKSLQEHIYKDKYLNKYFYINSSYHINYVRVKKVTGDKLLCDIIIFNIFENIPDSKLTNGRLIENYEYSVYELGYYEEIKKQEFDDKIKLMTEQKFNISF